MSLLKNEIKFLRSLHQKKYRDLEGLFVVEGPKMVLELLAQERFEVDKVYAREQWVNENETVNCTQVSEKELERISALSQPNQVLATVRIPRVSIEIDYSAPVLILDGISDPGNLGTILRTADWFGIGSVIASKDSVELYNPKVVQSSMGSIFRLTYERKELTNFVADLVDQGYSIYLAEMDGEPLNDAKFPAKTAIVMGSESHGVRGIEGESITIKRFGKSESLNVAIACGIVLQELKAQLG